MLHLYTHKFQVKRGNKKDKKPQNARKLNIYILVKSFPALLAAHSRNQNKGEQKDKKDCEINALPSSKKGKKGGETPNPDQEGKREPTSISNN